MITTTILTLLLSTAPDARASRDYSNDKVTEADNCSECEQKYMNRRLLNQTPPQQYAELQPPAQAPAESGGASSAK